jgi:antitoxin MazE2
MTMLSVRVADGEASDVREWASRLGVEQSQLLREAIHRHLVWLRSQCDVEAWLGQPLSAAEQSLAEIADWGPAEDWSDWADAAR